MGGWKGQLAIEKGHDKGRSDEEVRKVVGRQMGRKGGRGTQKRETGWGWGAEEERQRR